MCTQRVRPSRLPPRIGFSLNAYELDRRRDDARDLYLAARRQGHRLTDQHLNEEREESLARVNEEVHRGLIPQNDLMEFLEDWFIARSVNQVRSVSRLKSHGWRCCAIAWKSK